LASGGVKCWGAGLKAGSGSATNHPDRFVPTDVTGLTSGVTSISAGYNHTCALTGQGAVKCWGHNGFSQLGDGTTTNRYAPVDSAFSSGTTGIASGAGHTCVLTDTGGVKCWGATSAGQVGDGRPLEPYGAYSTVAVDVVGLSSGVSALSAGAAHSCAITSGGGLKCWGAGGQLGDASQNPSSTPVGVIGLSSGVSRVAAGYEATCALHGQGQTSCWGNSQYGELGGGQFGNRLEPVNITNWLGPVSQISQPDVHNCAVTLAGGVKCWGYNNFGELGNGTRTTSSTPVDVVGLDHGVASVHVGTSHSCALMTDGTVRCWGYNGQGQVGNNSSGGIWTTPQVVGVLSAQTVAFTPISGRDVGDAPFTVTATASSGLPVTVTSNSPSVCSVSGSTVTVSKIGICTLTARQPGNDDYSEATATRSFLVTGLTASSPTRLSNISTRMQVLAGEDVLIGGFAIYSGTKTLLIRARGPSLAASGVPNPLPNPKLQLFSGSSVIASNDDFVDASNVQVIRDIGFAPTDNRESAILVTLGKGLYTAIVSPSGTGATGVGLMEVFELDAEADPIINLSTRGKVLTASEVMIGGFIISGNTPQTVVVRARGPSLTPLGVAGALADPTLELVRSSDQLSIASNDNWQSASNAAQVSASGFAPSDARESAILITLSPGAYTAIVRGVNDTTGVGIVEVFAAQ
jgi:alpha-tubulin suppressor-like RCC1 family protein